MMERRIRLLATEGKKIYLDIEGEEGIYLYPGEIKKCGLKDGMLLSLEEIEKLRSTFAVPRAKKRALGILVRQDQTAGEIITKLKKSGNDSRSIQAAMDFLVESGYVDDLAYARDYLHSRRKRKSFRMIRQELMGKGISSDIIDLVFEEEGEQKREDLEEQVARYARRFHQHDRASMDKVYAHFYRKGYDTGLVRDILREIWQD